MARLTRHELKKDEFQTRMAVVSEFLRKNQQKLAMGSAAGLLVAGITVGVFLYIRSQQAKGAEAFAGALETYHAFVTPSPPANVLVPYFKTSEEKNKEALQKFTEVSGRFGRYSQGRMARYYAALCQRELGKLAEAEKALQSIAREGDSNLAALAKMALAGIYLRTGRVAEAEKLYREIESHPTVTVPKATVQIALAELYLSTKPAQAMELYKQMKQEYPGTAAGDLASKMLEEPPR